MERRERNAVVQELRLDGCYNISEDEMAKLEELVVDLILGWRKVARHTEVESEIEIELDQRFTLTPLLYHASTHLQGRE